MGNNSGPGCSSSSSPAHSYSFVRQLTPNTKLLTNQHDQQVLALQRTFPSEEMLKQHLSRQQATPHPTHAHYLTPIHTEVVALSHLCGRQYKIIEYYPYLPHCLLEETAQRAEANRPFTQPQLVSILCSCVLAMSHLTKHDIPHHTLSPDDLLIDPQGRIKIKHSSLSTHKFDFSYHPDYYYAPQTLKMIKQPSTPNGITHKSAVFTLGVTMLHAATLTPQSYLYDSLTQSINPKLVAQSLQQVDDPQLACILEKMLKIPSYERITFPQLEEMLYAMMGGSEQSSPTTQEQDQISKLEQSISKIRNQEEEEESQMNLDCSALRPFLDQPPLPHYYQPHSSAYNVPLQADQEDIHQQNIQHILHSQSDSLVLDEYDNNPATEWSNQNSPYPPPPQTDRDTPSMRTPLGPNSNLINLPPPPLCYPKKAEQKQYVVEEESQGRYEGYKVNGLKHGFGSFYYRQGGKYCGEWAEGQMAGRGVLYYSSGKIAYEGEWQANRLEGYGVLYNQNIHVIEGQCDYRRLSAIEHEWIKYEGYFRADLKDGQGTLYLSNGQTHAGSYHEDQPHGPGQFRNVRGEVIPGYWLMGNLTHPV